MKKTILIILIILAAILIFFIILSSVNFGRIMVQNLTRCSSNEDCIIVGPKSCCEGDTVINKDYEFLWNLKPAVPCRGGEQCKGMGVKLDYSFCFENHQCIGVSAYQLSVCSSDDDCILVKGRGCCGCDSSINKNYEKFWYSRSVESCPGRECEVCPSVVNAKCIDNKCRWTNQ